MTPAGYWPSDWPVECGGNHRPKAAPGPGLRVGPTDHLVATTRHTGRWPVMFVQRDRGELYLHGTSLGDGPTAAGWVERVDPVTLAPLARSGDLPTGGHEWCGSVAVHANGDLYTVNGSYLHRLDPDCRVVAEKALPVDQAHNGLLILGDGSIVTKDLRLGSEPSTLTVLGPELEVLASVRLPEPSMGRIAAVPDPSSPVGPGIGPIGGPGPIAGRVATAGPVAETIYVPGATRLFRYRWDGTLLVEDPLWRPTYRAAGRGGLAWDPTVADGRLWLLDNGNVPGVVHRFSTSPTLRTPPGDEGTGDGPPWTEPVRLLGFDTTSGTGEDPTIIFPTELPSGWAIAPPLVNGGVAVGWDTGNTGLVAFDVSPGADLQMLWYQPFRSSMQPLVYPDSGELVVNDFRHLEDGSTSDDVVVLDLATGRMKARVETGATRYNGMFLTPGWGRDLYYCSFGTVARIEVVAL